MFHFDDVDARNFNAILRRSFVWRVKARFEDPHVIAEAYEDIHKDGVFPKDPDLAVFLTSPPAVGAGLQIQHAFEAEYSKQDCVNMIENYVTWGGDGGLTENTMRAACGVPLKDVRAVGSRKQSSLEAVLGSPGPGFETPFRRTFYMYTTCITKLISI